MVAESLAPGASVSKVAQLYGVNAQSVVHVASAGLAPLWTKIANAWQLDSLFEFMRERSGLKHFDA